MTVVRPQLDAEGLVFMLFPRARTPRVNTSCLVDFV
jgi:hypothetical protein